ncbi:glycosyltransferase family 4 protein [Isosphaeraceae bacterium EP7]
MRLALTYQRVDPSRGGAETYAVDLCHRLIRAGHDLTLYADSWRDNVLPPEVRTVRVPARGPNKLARIWNFGVASEAALIAAHHDCSVGLINTWHQDVIIPQGGVHPGSLEANARRFAPGWRRRAYVAAKKANPKWWVYRAIEQRQYDPARATRIVAVSRMVENHLERHHRVDHSRVTVIPNAIDPDRLLVPDPAAARRAFRAEHGIAEGDLTCLFLAHNFWLKGLKPLMEALALRKRRDPAGRPMTLLVCGGGTIAPFRAMAEKLGLADSVRLVGFVDDIRAAFHAADFFTLPSYYDPCSLVVFEALSCGLPVITTGCNGAGEVLTEGREGFVINTPEAVAHLADALDGMVDDHRRAAMSEAALRLGREQSIGRHVSRLIEVFESVAADRRAGRRACCTPHSAARLGSGVIRDH